MPLLRAAEPGGLANSASKHPLPYRSPTAIIPVSFPKREEKAMFRDEKETLTQLKSKLDELRRYL
jgi:hypothetical protein